MKKYLVLVLILECIFKHWNKIVSCNKECIELANNENNVPITILVNNFLIA